MLFPQNKGSERKYASNKTVFQGREKFKCCYVKSSACCVLHFMTCLINSTSKKLWLQKVLKLF